jgi:hypothetical protein
MNLAHELRVATDHGCLVLHGEINLTVRDELYAPRRRPVTQSH